MRLRPPWWFCTGWWSPWCVLDRLLFCKIERVCKRHDDAQTRAMWRDESDWLSDPHITTAERMARFEALDPRPTQGPPSPYIITNGPQTGITGSAATITWRG